MSVKEELSALGVKPNKALGQNFLTDENAIAAICAAVSECSLPIIEIGPGLGALTLPLARTGLKLAAVELDARMAEILIGKLESYPNACVVNEDILKTDLDRLHAILGGGEITVCGNLPYYITSPICERLVCSCLPIKNMILMMQREAADRFFACEGDKNYVPLTVFARSQFEVQRLLELTPEAYYPQPEVASTVLVFKRKEAELPQNLWQVLRASFAMRRKTLYNNLPALGISKQRAAEVIELAGLPTSVRAEAVSCEKFIELASLIAEGGENK